jgi:ATP/maltotriose-dependent transcriptional regulator MalT
MRNSFIVGLAELEILAGEYEPAEKHLRIALDGASKLGGDQALVASASAMYACVLCQLGRYPEAEQLACQARELAPEGDAIAQALWRQAAALAHSAGGELDEAERLAREAVAFTQKTDALLFQGDALADLAEVLAARDTAAVSAALNDALDCYEQKGIIPLARRTRERLAALQAPTA